MLDDHDDLVTGARIVVCVLLACVLVGCSLTMHVDILANNNILATRSQTSSDDSAPEMLVEGGGTTDAALSVPIK